jgi:hypothetical protein
MMCAVDQPSVVACLCCGEEVMQAVVCDGHERHGVCTTCAFENLSNSPQWILERKCVDGGCVGEIPPGALGAVLQMHGSDDPSEKTNHLIHTLEVESKKQAALHLASQYSPQPQYKLHAVACPVCTHVAVVTRVVSTCVVSAPCGISSFFRLIIPNHITSCFMCTTRFCVACEQCTPTQDATHSSCQVTPPVATDLLTIFHGLLRQVCPVCCISQGIKGSACTHMVCTTPGCGARFCSMCLGEIHEDFAALTAARTRAAALTPNRDFNSYQAFLPDGVRDQAFLTLGSHNEGFPHRWRPPYLDEHEDGQPWVARRGITACPMYTR